MISRELAKKVRLIEIASRKAANDGLAGEYRSVFKGQGIEFNEVREYQPGDDVRSIDWNVTARMGHPFIKRFEEERELTLMFLVDLSASGAIGMNGRTKNQVASEVCALLAFSAIHNNDKIGLIVFTDRIELVMPPSKGAPHVLRLIEKLLSFRPRGTGTDLQAALEYFSRIRHKRCVLFLVSDFLASAYERPLRSLARQHDLIALSISDPLEFQLPRVGLVEVEDAENGELIQIDAGSAHIRKAYERLSAARSSRLRGLFRWSQIDHVEISTDRGYTRELVRFFRARQRRSRPTTSPQ